jgi:hypothetical protein
VTKLLYIAAILLALRLCLRKVCTLRTPQDLRIGSFAGGTVRNLGCLSATQWTTLGSGVKSHCRSLGRVLPPGLLSASSAPGLGVAVAPFGNGVLWCHRVTVGAGLELHWRGHGWLDARDSYG